MADRKLISFEDYLCYDKNSRGNLGADIPVLRIESIDEEKGEIMLTVSEDADCSGLPVLGETVCNYDEGFISGILSVYSGKEYRAVEIDCWATGNRVCRFRAAIEE